MTADDFPRIIHIENTNLCNANCIMCPHDSMKRQMGIMNMKLFKKLIDECSSYKYKCVHLHGFGEPFIDDKLVHKISYAKSKGINYVYIVTNGSLLDDGIIGSIVGAGLDGIKISFYGATADTYNMIHRGLNFYRVMSGVTNLFSYRKRAGVPNPAITLQFLFMDENNDEWDTFVDMWSPYIDKSYGDSISRFKLHNYAYGKSYNTVRKDVDRIACRLPFVTMNILWNGDVVPCCYDYDASTILSNVRDNSIYDVWHSDDMQRIRDAHNTKKFYNVPICDNCDQLMEVDNGS